MSSGRHIPVQHEGYVPIFRHILDCKIMLLIFRTIIKSICAVCFFTEGKETRQHPGFGII